MRLRVPVSVSILLAATASGLKRADEMLSL